MQNGTTVSSGRREATKPGGLVLTRAELAAVLQVSVRTVDRMVMAGDIPAMDLGEDLVRFYLPDVLEALRSGKLKFGRRAGQPNIQHSTFSTQHPAEGESHKGANGNPKCVPQGPFSKAETTKAESRNQGSDEGGAVARAETTKAEH